MMKKTNNNLTAGIVLQKISLAVFGITTVWLLGMSAHLLSLFYSKEGWFTEAQWADYFRYPDYAKYLLVIQIISLILLVVTTRMKRKN